MAASGSDADVVTFAPRRLRLVGTAAVVVLVAVSLLGWFALPGEIRVLFTPFQLLTLLGVLAALVVVVLGVAASSVRADATGLRIRNGLRVHEVAWSRVHRVVMRPGDAWAFVLLGPADGPEAPAAYEADLDTDKLHLVGIQAVDRTYAGAAVAELRRRRSAATRSRGT